MKSFADAVIGTFLLANVMLVMWVIGVPWINVHAIIPICALLALSAVGVAAIAASSWFYGKPYQATWLHLSLGASAIGSGVMSARFLLLLSGAESEMFLSVLGWIAAFGWGATLGLFLKWLANPVPQSFTKSWRPWRW